MQHAATTCAANASVAPAVTRQLRARKAPRYRLKQGFVAYSDSNFCEIRNISESGIGLQYLAHQGSDCEEMSHINILNNLEGFMLNELSCRVVYVKDIHPTGQHGSSVIRKIGLQFTNLSADQQQRIHDLLSHYASEQDMYQH